MSTKRPAGGEMASLHRDDATNALPVLTRRRGLLFFFSLTFCRFVHGATEGRKRKRKKRRTAHALHRLRLRGERSGDSITRLNLDGANPSGRGEKADFKGLSFLPEIRVIAICPWNRKIVEQSEGGRGYYALKERVEKFPCRKAYAC